LSPLSGTVLDKTYEYVWYTEKDSLGFNPDPEEFLVASYFL